MATMQDLGTHLHHGVDFTRYPELSSHFSPEQIDRLLEEDLNAGRSVPGVLIAVISSGLVLAILSTIAVLAWYV